MIKKLMSFMNKKDCFNYFLFNILSNLVVAISFNIIIALVSQNIFKAAIIGDYKYIKNAIYLFIIPFFIGLLTEPIFRYLYITSVNKTINTIRVKLYEKISLLSIKEYDSFHSGSLLSRITNDVENITDLFKNQIGALLFAFIIGTIPLFIIFYYEVRMGFFVCFLGVLQIIVNNYYSKQVRRNVNSINQQFQIINEMIVDIMDNFHINKIFNIEKTIFNLFRKENKKLMDVSLKKSKESVIFDFLNSILNNSEIVVILFGYYLCTLGYMDISSVIAISLLQGNAIYLFGNLGSFVTNIQMSLSSAERIIEIFELDSEEITKEEAEIKVAKNHVEKLKVTDLTFSYLDEQTILKNINLEANKTEVIGIVGKSGSGKSTLIKLLLSFYSFEQGNIYLDDVSFKDLEYQEIRKLIAYIPQRPYLFKGTILENIKYGNELASMEDIVKVCKQANIYDFIMKLPEGFETVAETGGTNFSGGQIQRICIARALLKNTPIILFDEATSALDAHSSQLIKNVIYGIKDKIIIIIDHNISMVKNADKIYVIDKGEVVEEGKHDVLMKEKQLYYDLYSLL